MNNILLKQLENIKNIEIDQNYPQLKKSHKNIEDFVTSYIIKHPQTVFLIDHKTQKIDNFKQGIQHGGNNTINNVDNLNYVFNKFQSSNMEINDDIVNNLDNKITNIIQKYKNIVSCPYSVLALNEMKDDTLNIINNLDFNNTLNNNNFKHDTLIYNEKFNKNEIKFLLNVKELATLIKSHIILHYDSILLLQLNTIANQFLNSEISEHTFLKEYNLITLQQKHKNELALLNLPIGYFNDKYTQRQNGKFLIDSFLTHQKVNTIEYLLESHVNKKQLSNNLDNTENNNLELFLVLMSTCETNQFSDVFLNYINSDVCLFYLSLIMEINNNINNNQTNFKVVQYIKKYHLKVLKVLELFLKNIYYEIILNDNKIIDISLCTGNSSNNFLLFNYFRRILNLYFYEVRYKNQKIHYQNICTDKHIYLPNCMVNATCLETGSNLMIILKNTENVSNINQLHLIRTVLNNVNNLKYVKFRVFEIYGKQISNCLTQNLTHHGVHVNSNNLVYNKEQTITYNTLNLIDTYLQNSDTYTNVHLDLLHTVFTNVTPFLKQMKMIQLEKNNVRQISKKYKIRSVLFYDFVLTLHNKQVRFLFSDLTGHETRLDMINLYVDSIFEKSNFLTLFKLGLNNLLNPSNTLFYLEKIKLMLKSLIIYPKLAMLFDLSIDDIFYKYKHFDNLNYSDIEQIFDKIIKITINKFIKEGYREYTNATKNKIINLESIIYNNHKIIHEGIYINNLMTFILNDGFTQKYNTDDENKIISKWQQLAEENNGLCFAQFNLNEFNEDLLFLANINQNNINQSNIYSNDLNKIIKSLMKDINKINLLSCNS